MFKVDNICHNCRHEKVPDNEVPCTNCVPHSEGWSGFEAREAVVERTAGDVMDELVRKVAEVNKLMMQLNQHIK